MKYWAYFMAFLLFIVGVSAFDANIITYRSVYNPGETFQAEVLLDEAPSGSLTHINFDLYREKSIAALIFVEKLNDRHYFIYFNIPDAEGGTYYFRLKNVKYLEGEILKSFNKNKEFKISNLNPGFDYLIENQNQDGSLGNIKETSLATLALKNVYGENAENALSYLVANADPLGCYPKGNCNVIDTSFALITLKNFNQNYIKTKNWLNDAGNNFDIGSWQLEANGNGVCNYNNQNYTISGQSIIDIADANINLNCSSRFSFILNHNYLGSSHNIIQNSGNNLTYTIDDSGCYGLNYRSSCDYISTLYASWALKDTGENFPQDYLTNNRLDNRTIDHALGYLIYNDEYSRDWLLNNQINDYWSYYSASISQSPDYYVSALAAYALKNEIIFEDAKNYLNDKTGSNVLTSSMILHLLFDDQVKFDSISISPGIVNNKNSFDLILTNNGNPLTALIEAPNFTGLPSSVSLIGSSVFNINVPSSEGSFEINLEYANKSYTIPVILESISEGLVLLPPPRDALKFILDKDTVNLTLNKKDILIDELKFTNEWDVDISNASIILTGNLGEIVKLDQDHFDVVNSGGMISIEIMINSDKNPKLNSYQGFVVLKSEKTVDSFAMILNFKEDYESTGEKVFEDNEEIAEEESTTSPSKRTEDKKSGNLWWLWMVIIVIIGIVIFLFLRRRKVVEEDIGDFIKKN